MKKYLVTYATHRGVELENTRDELADDSIVLTRREASKRAYKSMGCPIGSDEGLEAFLNAIFDETEEPEYSWS